MAEINIGLTTSDPIVDAKGSPLLAFVAKWQRKLASAGDMYAEGSFRRKIYPLSANEVDCSLGNYFTKSVAANTAFTFVNPPMQAYGFTLEIAYTSGALTFPAEVSWPSATVPTWAAGAWLVTFNTIDQGANWFGDALGPYA